MFSSSSRSSSSSSSLSSRNEALILKRRNSSVDSIAEQLDRFGLSDDKLILHEEVERGDEIGKGGFGIVYKGKIANDGGQQEVAIKRLPSVDLSDVEESSGFLTEAAIANLDHPCIVKLIALCAQAEDCFLVFHLELGGSLRDYFDTLQAEKTQDQLPWTIRLEWAINIASALQYLHENRIVHRDLKSANIFLNEKNDHVKIGDFGSAAILKDEQVFLAEEGCGTMTYWAPELLSVLRLNSRSRLEKEKYPYSLSSDIYAFTIILWELINFLRPYVELKGFLDNLDTIIEGNYRPPLPPESIQGYSALFAPGWHQESTQRPDASTVHHNLIEIQQQLKKI